MLDRVHHAGTLSATTYSRMVVLHSHGAGRKQGNLGRPPCIDIGERREERNLKQGVG